MDGEEPTQATQNVLDPRREGKQNSGFSDDDISDIICVLYAHSDSARQEVQRLAAEDSPYIIGKDEADGVEPNYELEDHASRFESNPSGHGNYAIILRLSSSIKDPSAGYAFGRNGARCDVVFKNDPLKRVSNIHFRIYVNEYGNVMIEDQSTNGTFVDRNLLTARPKGGDPRQAVRRWVLNSGMLVRIYLHQEAKDLAFRVRIPRRDDEFEQAYLAKVAEFFLRHGLTPKDGQANGGGGGTIDIFAKNAPQPPNTRTQLDVPASTRSPSKRVNGTTPRDWNTLKRYNKIHQIGKGAFAVVYKVTAQYDGRPYAAKELEKRRFMKNGVLDQKVDNEMNIMKKIQHPNIVRYIENIEWEDRLLIIIMEYVPGGDLGKLISEEGPLPEAVVQSMSKQLLGALEYLHQNNITHRDVKPDNILISNLDPIEVKLTDFGLSKMVDTEQTFLRTFCGTLLYCAPEVYTEYAEYDDNGFRSRGHKVRRMPGQRYNHAVDIWSLGGVLFFSLTTSPPYPVKSGISYSELLHKIMTTRLNITPLQNRGVSERGIDFLSRMLQRRPENRATILELDTHSWLGGDASIIEASQSYDDITDSEDLAIYTQQPVWDEDEDRVSDSMGEDSEKENNDVFGEKRQGQQPKRLFGEIGTSAIGSSGVMPDEFLNLPVSMRNTEILDSHEDESYGSGLSTPAGTRTYRQDDRQMTYSIQQNQSADQLQSLVENVASQSLGGHGQTNRDMASSRYQSMDFNTSKRKPASHETSDEFDENSPPDKPIMKRLKSEGNIEYLSEDMVEEAMLLACVPQIRRLESGRQFDDPVGKEVFWDKDRSTWHLDYPEMTDLQLGAFQQGAKERGEVFGPGKTPLWALAMQYFPPTSMSSQGTGGANPSMMQTHIGGLKRDDRKIRESSNDFEFPPTALPATAPGNEDIPDTQPGNQIVVPVQGDTRSSPMVGWIGSHPRSCVSGISISITEPFVSFGRHPDNTEVYPDRTQSKVPKHAFKVMLWKEGYDSTKEPMKGPYPWSKRLSIEDEHSYSFWISTKATLGIMINGQELPSEDSRLPSSPSRHWAQLHHGDDIVIWGKESRDQTALSFRCEWGASSQPRDPHVPLELASYDTAQKLDAACAKTERRFKDGAEKKRKRGDAEDDLLRRRKSIERERERSRIFEARRSEAVEFLQARGAHGFSRRASPASAPSASTILGSKA